MEEDWYSFPAQMDEHPAYVTFNNAFAKESESNRHKNHIVVKTIFQIPTEYGMPAGEENEILEHIDNLLVEAINSNAGIYVGHVTINGQRYSLLCLLDEYRHYTCICPTSLSGSIYIEVSQ